MRLLSRRKVLELAGGGASLLALDWPLSARAAQPVVLRRSNGAEPDSLDPHKTSGTWEANIIGDMLIGLMTEDMSGRPIYGSAMSHTESADGLGYTFKLRAMTWSDGTPLTADDFVFAFQRILNPATASRYASLVYPIKNAQAVNGGKLPLTALGARAADPQTLEVTLENPTPYFINLLVHHTMFPVPRHVIDKVGDAWIKPEYIQVNGAYKLVEWVPNSIIRLARNTRFYDVANVQIDEIDYYPIADNSVALQRFRAGALDVTNDFPTREYQKLKSGGYTEVKPSEVHVFPYVATTYVLFNTQKPPFTDPQVRRALSLAIDRSAITDKILGTGQVPAYSLVPHGMANYDDGPELDFKEWPMDKRLAEAKRLLQSAGFTPDKPLRFTYRYRENVDTQRIAVALQAMWKTIGVDVQLLNSETATHYNALRTQDFDVADAGWVADYNDAEDFLFMLQSSAGQMNYGKYNNARYDALMAQAAQTHDLAARAGILKQAEQIELADEPLAPLFYSVSRSLVKDYVKGWQDNVLDWHRSRYLRIERSP